ncbi:hypothetical protein Nepgr_018777 [Nepenthes gracilis]|uniref:Uncharacterized protein n=1 Tax=Nepenthes gracilis TaxID=150966 RepID=A0AAD3XUN1_NEPGR|nr:hypothetical protein Nepgr_018777 [Nepenthes gracilis]
MFGVKCAIRRGVADLFCLLAGLQSEDCFVAVALLWSKLCLLVRWLIQFNAESSQLSEAMDGLAACLVFGCTSGGDAVVACCSRVQSSSDGDAGVAGLADFGSGGAAAGFLSAVGRCWQMLMVNGAVFLFAEMFCQLFSWNDEAGHDGKAAPEHRMLAFFAVYWFPVA